MTSQKNSSGIGLMPPGINLKINAMNHFWKHPDAFDIQMIVRHWNSTCCYSGNNAAMLISFSRHQHCIWSGMVMSKFNPNILVDKTFLFRDITAFTANTRPPTEFVFDRQGLVANVKHGLIWRLRVQSNFMEVIQRFPDDAREWIFPYHTKLVLCCLLDTHVTIHVPLCLVEKVVSIM